MKVTSEGFIDDIDKRAEENDKRIADAISDDENIKELISDVEKLKDRLSWTFTNKV
jgi:hypothetical protein